MWKLSSRALHIRVMRGNETGGIPENNQLGGVKSGSHRDECF